MVREGVLRAFDAGTYTATVEERGSRGWVLTGVLVSRGIASGEMVAGRRVVVAAWDISDPGSMMVVGVR